MDNNVLCLVAQIVILLGVTVAFSYMVFKELGVPLDEEKVHIDDKDL